MLFIQMCRFLQFCHVMITEKPENDYKLLKRKDLQKVLSPVIYFKYLYLQQNVCMYVRI